MSTVSKTKNKKSPLTSLLLSLGFNLLVMVLMGFLKKKINPAKQKQIKNFTEGEVVE